MPDAIDYSVDKPEVKAFPKSFARQSRKWIDEVTVIELVDSPFIDEDLRKFPQWCLTEQCYSDSDTAKSKQHG